MRVNKAPCGVTHTVSIAKGNITSNDTADSVKGGILKGTKYAWLCQGPFLKIIDVSNGEKIAGWRFGAACSEFVTEVSCAVELPYSDNACNLKQIVLGLECEVIGGMICIFDVQGSRLVRAIRIPGKPLSLSIVDSGSSGCEGRYPLPGLLSSMSGIIAVGLKGGSVFLVDLCRVTCDELLNTWFNDDREEVHDEINPCQLLPINSDDDDSDKLEKKCAAAAVSGDHLCLLLNEAAFVQDNFLLLEPGGEVCATFKTRNIGVTSLLYVPRIASLVVGYSFGCFQLWNLMHLTLNYTSHTMKDPLPVMHLGFMEPSDDPCNFCYLWAVHSSTDEFPSSSPPVGIMYALSYDSKEWVDGYGYLYQDYQSCHFRFEYNLEVDASEDVDSTCCVSFSTLTNAAIQRNMSEDEFDEGTSENDFSLCIFVWEAYDSENKPISTYLSLFDLNQWYKDQMPVQISDADDENLGYLVTFSLNCIRQKGEESSQLETPLLDVRVDPENLTQFKLFQSQEEHYHPSALSFVSHCLLEDKIISLSHPGLQRYLLLYMEKEGPICLLRPVNLFKHCVMVGLKPFWVDMNGSSEVPAVTQREFLLSVALENQMLGFLHRCASDWANGSVSGVDCSLPMFLTWGFERAMVLKETADGLCAHLFDHTGIRLDKNECRLLDNCASQLRQLATLFEGILSDCRLLSLLNLEDFRQKTNELNLVALYFEVLLWFLNVGLLPEFPENDFDNEPSDFANTSVDKIPYPSSVLTKFYTDRRLEFKNLNLKNGTKASLYVDQLLQNESNGPQLASLWQSDGGSGLYPPPSIQSLLAMYLQDGIDIQTKNSIVIYVFLDLATLLDPERYSRTIEYFVKFPCAFCMTPSIIKVTQAFWLLDQKHFEDALDMVLDPLVSPKDLQPWQHRFIVHALLSQGQHNKALEYFTVRQLPIQSIEDIQLKITLLVMNKQVGLAYDFLQQYHNEENDRDLLYHFYQECGKAQQLGTVLKLMLSPAEEDLLMQYLQTCNISQSEDMQVVFYLMRSRVIEAVAVNERINFLGNRKVGSRRTRNDPTVRDVLVEGYAKTLPSVTRQLANYCSQQKKLLSNWRRVQRPTPMSVDVRYGVKQPVSYKSSLIQATLEKARETWMMPIHSSFNSEAGNKEMMDVSAMQNLPFLCTSHDTLRHDRETTPVVFPSVTSSVKRRLDDDGGAQSSTPLKRSRLERASPIENILLLSNKKSTRDRSSNDSSLLLKTPLVKRVTPVKQLSNQSVKERNASKPFAESFTPHSILKVRNLVRSSVSPEKLHGIGDDPVSREQTRDERSCARQIRFSLPVPNDKEIPPLSCSTPAHTVKTVKTSNRVVDASARLPLRSSLSLLQKPVVTNKEAYSTPNVTWKKSFIQKSPLEQKINDDNICVFGSASSSTDKLDVDGNETRDNVDKLNDSVGEEAFYSASSSSDSGTSKECSRMDVDDNSSKSIHKKYSDSIKEIKPRRHLSRLKSETQSILTDSHIGEQKELVRDLDEKNQSDSEEDEESPRIVSGGRKALEMQEVEEPPRIASVATYKQITFAESGIERDTVDFQEEEDDSDRDSDNNITDVIYSKRSILGDSYIDKTMRNISNEKRNYSFRNETDLESEMPQGSRESPVLKIQQIKARRPLPRKEIIVANLIVKKNVITVQGIRRGGEDELAETDSDDNESYADSDDGETNVVFLKKSILGDSVVDESISNKDKIIDISERTVSSDERNISFSNESVLKDEMSQKISDNSVLKIQQIKPRRPLPRKEIIVAESVVKRDVINFQGEGKGGGGGEEDEMDSDDNESNPDTNVVFLKKSILGDSISSESISNKEISQRSSDERNISFMSESVLEEKVSQGIDENSVLKIQQIKARRPLSRVRKSGNFDNSRSSVFESSSCLETSIFKTDILLDDTNVQIFDVEDEDRKENMGDKNDSEEAINKYRCMDDDDVEIVEEKANISLSSITPKIDDHGDISITKEIASSVMWSGNAARGDESSYASELGKMLDTVFQESNSLYLEDENVYKKKHRSERKSKKYSAIEESIRDDKCIEKDSIEVFSEGNKTYASLTSVSTENSAYEHILPHNRNDINQGVAFVDNYNVSEDHGNLSPLNSLGGGVQSALTSADSSCNMVQPFETTSSENVCAVDDGIITSENNKSSALYEQNRDKENNKTLIEQDSVSTSGDTSGTIELESDETEEKNVGRTQQDQTQKIPVEAGAEDRAKDSFNEKKDDVCVLHSVNVQETFRQSDEIIVIDSDSECNKAVSTEQQVVIKERHEIDSHQKSFDDKMCEEQGTNKEGNTDLSDPMNQEECDLVLKLSDGEMDSEDNFNEGDNQHEIIEDLGTERLPVSNVNLEKKLDEISSEMVTSAQHPESQNLEVENMSSLNHYSQHIDTYKNNEEQTLSYVSLRKSSICNEIISATNRSEEEMQTEEQNYSQLRVSSNLSRDDEKSEGVGSHQIQQKEVLILEKREGSPKMIADAKQSISITESSEHSVSSPSVPPEGPILTDVVKSQIVQKDSDKSECSLQFAQVNLPSSVQSEIPHLADVSMTEGQSVDTSHEPSRHSVRLRRRRSSLQIELGEVNNASISENKNMADAIQEVLTPKSRLRRRPSSVQSEPPEMIDVSEMDHQTNDQNREMLQERLGQSSRPRRRRSSLQIEHLEVDVESENKNNTAMGEISTPRTRLKNRPSSVQSEPPQMTDFSEIERQVNDQKVGTPKQNSATGNRSRRRRSSLQIEPLQMDDEFITENKDEPVAVGEITTSRSRQRSRPSSVQSEPPQMMDVLEKESRIKNQNIKTSQEQSEDHSRSRRHRSLQMEPLQTSSETVTENKNEIVGGQDELAPITRQRSRRSSVQSEHPLVDDISMKGNKVLDQSVNENSGTLAGDSIPRTKQRSRQSSISGELSDLEMPVKARSREHERKKEWMHDALLLDVAVPEKVEEASKVSNVDEPQPSTSFAPKQEENRRNLRSQRACSVDRDLSNTKDKRGNRNIEIVSDSDVCSVQSEPPNLNDVTLVRQLRSKSRKGLLKKKKSKTSSYLLRIPPPKLPIVKEEPENESSVAEERVTTRPVEPENVASPAFMSMRNLRRRKNSESENSQTGVIGEGQTLRSGSVDERVDSPVSISSRSTVIIDHSTKRKRCSSASSPEEPEVKKFQRSEAGNSAPESGDTEEKEEGSSRSGEIMEQYATARRLTRYQRTLMERSMDVTKGVHREFRGRPHLSGPSGEDSDGESVASGYTSGSSQVRSSARLQEKRQMILNRSPSQSSRASVTSDQSPEKRVTRHSSPAASSSGKKSENSPGSLVSGKSPSSVSSSQWPSPNAANIQSPLRPRRKSFQHAQKALFSPSTKKHPSSKASVTTTDTSEAESISETDVRISEEKKSKKDIESASESGSVRSQSSAVSSTVSRSTRSSSKHIETEVSPKSRRTQGKSTSHPDEHPQRELRQRKESHSNVSSSSEDSPRKANTLQKAPVTSGNNTQPAARTSQDAVKKEESRKSYSVFKKRKYFKLQLKKKTAS